jgi:hypothetical protein
MRTFLITGKHGDCVNALPLIHYEFVKTGRKPDVITSERYSSVFHGCSYINRIILYGGNWGDLHGAIAFAKAAFSDVVVLQCHGDRFPFAQTERSFQIEVFKRARLLEHWDVAAPVIDVRSKRREAALLSATVPKQSGRGHPFAPFILLGDQGQSAPFEGITELGNMLETNFGQTHKIIKLSTVKAEMIYDLLGLYERAACLVTIDTVHLHLAKASKVPIIALGRDGWVGAAPSKFFKLFAYYSQWDSIKEKLIGTVGAIISQNG